MMKRLLAMVLAILMVLTAFAACGKSGDTSSDQSTSSASTQQDSTAGESTAPAEKELIELKIGWANVGRLESDDWGKYILDKFKIKVTEVATDGDKLKMLATTGDLPDMFGSGVGSEFYNQAIEEELVRDIPDAMMDKFPNLKAYAEKGSIAEASRKALGKRYAIPRLEDVDNPPKAMTSGMYIRADWMKDLGKSMPTTTDELYDVLKAFTFNDPDKNGTQDTFGTSGWLWAIHFIPWTNIYGWQEENGKWIPGYVSDNLLPGLQFFNKLYKEKILDPEFAIAKDADLFYQNKIGMYYGNTGEYWLWTHIQAKFGGAHPEIADPFEAVQLVPPLKKDAASKPVWLGTFNGQCSLFGANCTDEKLERLLEIYEWLLTPEGRDFQNYGFKDKDYIIQDGEAVITLPMNDTQYGKMKFLWEVYPSVILGQLVSWAVTPATPRKYPIMSKEATELNIKFHNEIYGPHILPDNAVIENLDVPSKAEASLDLGAVETEIGKIIASDNVEAEFEKFRKTMYENNGLQKVVEEVTAKVAAEGLAPAAQ